MCAVGCLIPDELYDPKIEGFSALALATDFPEFAKHLNGVRPSLLSRMQILHDGHDPREWPTLLPDIAKEFNLTYTA